MGFVVRGKEMTGPFFEFSAKTGEFGGNVESRFLQWKDGVRLPFPSVYAGLMLPTLGSSFVTNQPAWSAPIGPVLYLTCPRPRP